MRAIGLIVWGFVAASFAHGVVAQQDFDSNARQGKALFDGHSLSGFNGESPYWRVEAGAIVGEIAPGTTLTKNTWLVWQEGQLSDFDLQFQFRITGKPGANSGVQFRSQVHSLNHVAGYQADLDMGTTWLGRIYDEEGRALLVERGTRVTIMPDGKRSSQTFAPAHQFAVLFREGEWNDYRIVAVGPQVDVYINGTLTSQLHDEEQNAADLTGALAFQLHSGGETRVEFRNIFLENLTANDVSRLRPLPAVEEEANRADSGTAPTSGQRALNLGFEDGTLGDWQVTGDAFTGQPVDQDGISNRWAGQTSGKEGRYFIGGYEKIGDRGVGTLESSPFLVTHPFGSVLIGGGKDRSTRAEIVLFESGVPARVLYEVSGDDREQMQRKSFDLREVLGKEIFIRLVDENAGGWGHLNFDDFRFHDSPPRQSLVSSQWRTTSNAVLHHLTNNVVDASQVGPVADTLRAMHVPNGFSVQPVAAEPLLHQPMAFTFDARGRLWVVEGHSYPQRRPEGEGVDRIVIFADEDHDGTFEKRSVFIEKLNLVSGLEVGFGGVWVGAAPYLLFIPDRDRDDIPDSEPQILLEGFGFADTHETLNSFMWGPDGWLYGNQGVFNQSNIGKPGSEPSERIGLNAGVWRYHPTRHQFEVFAHGGSNQWGLDFNQHGQIFMTHCRSFWGRGLTTHVIQGGHYWNQVNGGYAPFISAEELPQAPWIKNYLLASARYGHGEGGAGKPGSGEVYGGHSHVGTMIYLGDNWPDTYRNHLFTHNLHGHQINHQINQREAGGFNTIHAGEDVFFCSDPQFIGVDLQVGPDGAVYLSDWYDPRHCHNPNMELWDRGNGRIYRMQYDPTYQPAQVDYYQASDLELAETHLLKNDWHSRQARLELIDRSQHRRIDAMAIEKLKQICDSDLPVPQRLRALWTLHGLASLDEAFFARLLGDSSEYLRAWSVQLSCEQAPSQPWMERLLTLANYEQSLLVKRYLASAIQRLPTDAGLELGWLLAGQEANRNDRDLPKLLWQSIAQQTGKQWKLSDERIDSIRIPAIRDAAMWYAAKVSESGREFLLQRIINSNGEQRRHLLSLFSFAVSDARGVEQPREWTEIASELYESSDHNERAMAEKIGAVFGDQKLFQKARRTLSNGKADASDLAGAIALLALDGSPENVPLLIDLLDSQHAEKVIPLLRRYDNPQIGSELIKRLTTWDATVADAAVNVIASRPSWSLAMLDAIQQGTLPKDLLSAFVARQMSGLGDSQLQERLQEEWGNVGQSSAELQGEIRKTVAAYQAAPLWAFSESAGKAHFTKLCINCHQPNNPQQEFAPKLEGTRAKGAEYLIENIIDPNAVIGRDYQSFNVLTSDGLVISGLKQNESDSSVTIRTTTETIVIPLDQVEEMRRSENSFMPQGLLNSLNERERIELIKYIMTL